MKIVILMAGIGSRLGNPFPKCLTPLRDGFSILDHQLGNLAPHNGQIIGVVGFKKDLVMERHPELLYVYNPRYDQTNTAKSLLCALEHVDNEDVLWLNGDVVFDPRIVGELQRCEHSCMAVTRSEVGDEEIKYTVDDRGFIDAVSKQVQRGLGEAIGINLIKASDLNVFKAGLLASNDLDYFEKGLETAIVSGLKLWPLDATRYPCIEIDFLADLAAARKLLD